MIRMVVSDIDGTLVDRTETLSAPAFEMAKWLKERNILFSLATGRVQGMAEEYARALGIDVPYVTANGASLIHRGQVIYRDTIPLAPLQSVIRLADRLNMSIIYSPDGYERIHRVTPFILRQQQDFHRYFHVREILETDYAATRVEKLCVMDGDRTGEIRRIEELVKDKQGYRYTRYGNRAIEVVGKDATKANGIRRLADILQISMEEIMTVGDGENDLEMLTEASVGATVQNALDKVKQRAEFVAKESWAAGAFEAVRHYLDSAGKGV